MTKSAPRFPELHATVVPFACSVLANLAVSAGRGGLPTMATYLLRETAPGHSQFVPHFLPRAADQLQTWCRKWSGRPEFQPIMQALDLARPSLSAWQHTKETFAEFASNAIFYLLNDYWVETVSSSQPIGTWHPDIFEKLYATWELSLTQSAPTIESWVPLFGLDLADNTPLELNQLTPMVSG